MERGTKALPGTRVQPGPQSTRQRQRRFPAQPRRPGRLAGALLGRWDSWPSLQPRRSTFSRIIPSSLASALPLGSGARAWYRQAMSTITVRLPDEDVAFLRNFSAAQGTSAEAFLARQARNLREHLQRPLRPRCCGPPASFRRRSRARKRTASISKRSMREGHAGHQCIAGCAVLAETREPAITRRPNTTQTRGRDYRETATHCMGLTDIAGSVAGPGGKTAKVKFLVDSGATYTLLPIRAWRRLGLHPSARRSSRLQTAPASRARSPSA